MKKNLIDEIERIKIMIHCKIKSSGGFLPFAIAYGIRGNFMIQIEPWKNEEERLSSFEHLVQWLKQQNSYMVLLGLNLGRENSNAFLVVGKTPDKIIHVFTEYKTQDGDCIFKDDIIFFSEYKHTKFLQNVFTGAN